MPDRRSMDISVTEQKVCEGLKPLLQEHCVGESLGDVLSAGQLSSAFEFFLPEVLHEVHDDWQYESLDGVYSSIFRKTAEREIELIGLALFISDQTLTPLHFRLQLSLRLDRVTWIDLKLGERTKGGCRREPYGNSKVLGTMLHVVERLDTIDWYYHVGYGERET